MTADLDKSTDVLYTGQKYRLEKTEIFANWFERLSDTVGRARISKRLVRAAEGQFGDCKSVGDGVFEMRMFFGPGYRVYYMLKGDVVVVLLAGGNKDSQFRDIAKAKELALKVGNDTGDDAI
jgi:putative addiction module killer protein